jgi:hypothetical protein
MFDEQWLENWALQRAHEIVVREGLSLANAAQWLDKKRASKSSHELRNAIADSLLEAFKMKTSELKFDAPRIK